MDQNIKEIFYEKFSEFLFKKREDNCFYLSSDKYNKYISEVINAKAKKKK
jgi:hypothetical protein